MNSISYNFQNPVRVACLHLGNVKCARAQNDGYFGRHYPGMGASGSMEPLTDVDADA